MRTYRLFVGVLVTFMCGNLFSQQTGLTQELYINEIMQSTFGGTLDRLKEYPDGWVEIYNPGPNDISLQDYRIGKKNKFSKAYSLPNYTIPAGGYHVILCDKEDLVSYSTVYPDVVREIHTDFRISTDEDGGLYLFNPSGELVDSVHIPKMIAMNIGYGRLTDGADSIGYELQVTRGSANGGGHGKILPDPSLSLDSWASEKGEALSVRALRIRAMPDGSPVPDNLVVRITTNGTEPCDTSYILDKYGMLVTRNMVFKAAVFCEGYITPPAVTRTFILHNRDISLPIVSLVMDEDDLYSQDYGIITNNNTNSSRNNWRRPAVFDYFGRGGMATLLHQPSEVRISGAYSREAALKSMIIYADKRFGTEDFFKRSFWGVTRPDSRRAKSISIRNSGNDFGNSMFRDAVAQQVMGMNTDLDWMAAQPIIFYLNGEYKGIMNLRERGNEDNVWTHYDGLEDLTLIENFQLKEGDYQEYLDFVDFYSQPGHTLEEFNEVMDVEEYTNMMITNIYQSNTDFPGNNNVMWKPMVEGGRWRFIIKDVDRAFGIWGNSSSQQYLNWVTRMPSDIGSNESANSEEATQLFRSLMEIPEYRDMFIDRFSVYMGDFLNASYINSWIDWYHEQMEPEWDYFHTLYSINNKGGWENEINRMKRWTGERTDNMYEQLKDYFSLGSLVSAKVNESVSSASYYNITINGVPLTKGVLDGKLFAGREYLFDGDYNDTKYDVIGWEVTTQSASGTWNTQQYFEEQLTYIIPEGTKSFSINSILGTNGIEENVVEDVLQIVNTVYYNAQGISSDVPFKGLNNVKHTLQDGRIVIEKQYIK
ncbi:MAG: CotH kinase family protein [Bacteroidaceae bacterium]|nr:CotH kinase family protein [Bacteroidaceae bacterium]